MKRSSLVVFVVTVLAMTVSPVHADPGLLFHAETLDGAVVASRGADKLFNPASVVKVATTLWALERLGSDHRYLTTIGFHGDWQPSTGIVDGQLVVEGGGDPDFQTENVFLIARELNRLGIRRVSDGLLVVGPFTIGWERGIERRNGNQGERAQMMARRLQAALDPGRWDSTARASWEALCSRRGFDPGKPPAVIVSGHATAAGSAVSTPVLRHRSAELSSILRRFNVYSNNDIVRVADGLGGVAELETWLRRRLQVPDQQVILASASGEGRSRLTARLAVRLLRELRNGLDEMQLRPDEVLPLPGCDPGPVARMFPRLSSGSRARTTAVKTGTLRTTDDGVAVLSGIFSSPSRGEILFCIAAPRAGQRLWHWRSVEQAWLLDLMKRVGGATVMTCGPELPFSDTDAIVEVVSAAEGENS